MHDLRRMAVFAAVADAGSLGRAARHLGISTSAVSQQLQQLEHEAGLRLINRSTRSMNLTEAGAAFAAHCRAMVASAEAGWRQLAQSRDIPAGLLRISAPMGFARHVAPALSPLLEANPGLAMELLVADELIDLVGARIDLALRGGRLPDSAWVARRLVTLDRILCAAPAYLGRHGRPGHPGQLGEHRWLGLSGEGGAIELALDDGAGDHRLWQGTATVTSNHQQSLEQLCLAGLGIGVLVRADVDASLRSGALEQLLPQWSLPGIPIWAVTASRDNQPAKLRRALEALQAFLASLPGSRA